MGAELSKVRVLPKDVEGDATFSLQLINRMHLSSSPRGHLMLSEEVDKLHPTQAHLCRGMRNIVTTGGDKFYTLQHLSLAVDLDLHELLSSAALGRLKSS